MEVGKKGVLDVECSQATFDAFQKKNQQIVTAKQKCKFLVS